MRASSFSTSKMLSRSPTTDRARVRVRVRARVRVKTRVGTRIQRLFEGFEGQGLLVGVKGQGVTSG